MSQPAAQPPALPWLRRLDAVAERLRRHAGAPPPGGLTAADAQSGERWEAGQVWAHLAEICPYWVGQVGIVLAAPDDRPVAFGRTKADPGRLAAIEDRRGRTPAQSWDDVGRGIAAVHALLLGLDEGDLRRRGLHPTLGTMSLERILDEFLVGHLEEHADQLDRLAASP